MSKVKVNEIDKRSGSTLTLGGSGTTVQLGTGATQTGFGRTGTVNWDTTAKTAAFTAVSGNGYFVNTTSAAITVTLPSSPSAGDIVAIKDYAKTAETNNITIARNSSPLEGDTLDYLVNVNGRSITLIYVDGTQGWVVANDGSKGNITPDSDFLIATGGTVTTCGNCKIHTFTGPGTFCVETAGNVSANNVVSYMVVAAGGGGAGRTGGGGGAGGFREYKSPVSCYTASPLDGNPGGTSVTITAQGYPITIGSGGTGGPPSTNQPGTDGSTSVFSTITSHGGGGGGGACCPSVPEAKGRSGGSGGGGGYLPGPGPSARQPGGAGNTPPVSPPQGNSGGAARATLYAGGGGGGATAVGAGGNPSAGGAGATTCISGSPTAYGGGGGGGSYHPAGTPIAGGAGGTGGGGAGAGSGTGACSGTVNTGGGGGAGGGAPVAKGTGGNGGSGVVIIRYKYQ